jgi:hypothetical protein
LAESKCNRVDNLCKLFADDSKLIGIVKSAEDLARLQSDIDKVVGWAHLWRMKFNHKKCKYMVFGNRKLLNQEIKLTMKTSSNEVHSLEESSEEMDLGVCWRNDLKWGENVRRACSNAYNSLGLLKRTFKSWSNVRTFRTLYTTFVRPHLEYAAPIWNGLCKKDIKKLEKVQRRATKMVPQLRNMSYEERLLNLGITSLEERRIRGDLIQMFKIQRKINEVHLNMNMPNKDDNPDSADAGPAASVMSRRRSGIRIVKEFIKNCSIRDAFFANRVADEWNQLDEDVVTAKTVNEFKSKYDKSRKKKVLP